MSGFRATWVLCGIVSFGPSWGVAQPFPPEDLPGVLKPWTKWVLDGSDDRVCPVVGDEAVCLWPGRLAVEADAAGGRFELQAFADRELNVPLPGSVKIWPLAVTLDGRAAAVLTEEDRPVVRVYAGRHVLAGRFAWSELPDALSVPAELALVDLTVGGRSVASPVREEGLLLLKQQDGTAAGGEDLQIKVYRRLADGIPLWIETRVAIEASGKAREARLQGALVPDAVPVAVSGDLPARLDAGGVLRVQVRPGRFSVTVLARLEGRPASVAMASAASPWPAQEIWVFEPAEGLRQVQASGPPPIDPSRTQLPEDWKRHQAFLMEAGASLALAEARRGEPDPPPDTLSLERHFWLDLDGRSFSVRDEMTGQLGRTTRLELEGPGELTRASLAGADQLITQDPRSGRGGIELRDTALKLTAEARLPRGRLPAVGWNAAVQSLSAELRLPPGWGLLAAFGVDQADGTWAAQWDLIDVLLAVVIVLLAFRVLGRRWAVLLAVTLALTHGEEGALRLLWLAVLALAALRGLAAGAKWQASARTLWRAAMLLMVFVAFVFVARQLQEVLVPQPPGMGGLFEERTMFAHAGLGDLLGINPYAGMALRAPLSEEPEPMGHANKVVSEREVEEKVARKAKVEVQNRTVAFLDSSLSEQRQVPAAPPPPPRAEAQYAPPGAGVPDGVLGAVESPAAVRVGGEVVQTARNYVSPTITSKAYEQDPHAVIQTGAGMPKWSFSSYRLSWSGPVDPAHTMRLVLLPPAVNALLALLRALLVALLVMRLAAEWLRGRLPARLAWIAGALVAVMLLLPAAGAAEEAKAAPPPASGLVPSAELLTEMRDRLTRRPQCEPNCVVTAQLHVTAEAGDLRLEAEVHAGAPAAWPIPGPAAAWVPRSVTVDGQPAGAVLARREDGFLHLRLTAGVHQVVVVGPLPPADSLTLQLSQRPRRGSARASGWQIDGIRDDGTTDGSIQLTRRAGAKTAGRADGTYEPWLEVTRVLDIGVGWTAQTTIRRVSPTGAPVLVKVPLLKGMLVTDAEHQVKDGDVLVSLGRDETWSTISSMLTPVENEPIVLVAPSGKPWSEVWIVRCGPVWQCEASGLVPVSRRRAGRLETELRPWPGERVTLTFKRPKGQEGQSLTIDSAFLDVSPGLRTRDVSLSVRARASRADLLTIALPPNVELRAVTIDAQAKPARPERDNTLRVTVEAGTHIVRLTWRDGRGIGLLTRAPRVDLGRAAANVHVKLKLPEDRWLLATGGPSWGPRVLMWPFLLVVLASAWLLARCPGTPLARRDWLILGAGLVVAGGSVSMAVMTASWFLLLAWRRARSQGSRETHNLLQVVVVLLTLVFASALFATVRFALEGPAVVTMFNPHWYTDRIAGAVPQPWVLSVPLWVYRALMLSFVLWLVLSLAKWSVWAWGSFTAGGLWRQAEEPTEGAGETPVERG